MKQTVIAIVLALATVHHAVAQDDQRGSMQHGPHGNTDERIERMREHLGLTDEQVAEMREIRESGASRWEMREQMRDVLTEEQREMMRQHRGERGGKRGERPEDASDE